MRHIILPALAVLALSLSACSSDNANGGKGAGTSVTDQTGGAGVGTGGYGNTGYEAGSLGEFQNVVGDRVFFGYDSSELTGEGRATLDKQAAWLKQYAGQSITVEGHCDERGTREYNIALGQRRATAAKNYLVALGVPSSRIETVSYGKERPAVTGADDTSYADNRRAVTVLAGGAIN